jgi:hypothetical protein
MHLTIRTNGVETKKKIKFKIIIKYLKQEKQLCRKIFRAGGFLNRRYSAVTSYVL